MVPHARREWRSNRVAWMWGTTVSEPCDYALIDIHLFTGFAGPSLVINQPLALTSAAISRWPSSLLRFGQVPMVWSPYWGMDLRRREHVRPWAGRFGRRLTHVAENRVMSWEEMPKKWNGNLRRLGKTAERQSENSTRSWNGMPDWWHMKFALYNSGPLINCQ